jgi:hypothetical protein
MDQSRRRVGLDAQHAVIVRIGAHGGSPYVRRRRRTRRQFTGRPE